MEENLNSSFGNCIIYDLKEERKCVIAIQGNVAEWSKALALGASPKGRGFEPHRYHKLLFFLF